jgi:hypothetical protein
MYILKVRRLELCYIFLKYERSNESEVVSQHEETLSSSNEVLNGEEGV